MKPATFLSVVALLSAGIAFAAPAAAPASYDVETVEYEVEARDVEIEARAAELEIDDIEIEDIEDDDDEVVESGLESRALKNLPGLNAVQSAHARAIIAENKKEKLGKQGCYAAIATAITESNIYVYANKNVPASLKVKHDKVGSDHDSLGIFQQRYMFFKNIGADMDPAKSAAIFFKGMKAVKGWKTMNVGTLCQKVQRSACPSCYSKHVAAAKKICAADGF